MVVVAKRMKIFPVEGFQALSTPYFRRNGYNSLRPENWKS